jgi:hypothetical protein
MTTRFSLVLLVASCGGGIAQPPSDAGPGSDAPDPLEQLLANRVVDYGAALKTAALRLTGDPPTLAEIHQIDSAAEASRRTVYEALLRGYLGRPAFARQMIAFWRDTFKIGGTPMLDTAPVFAAKLAVENGSYLDLITRASGNCPTFDDATGTFADAECSNRGPKAGVLTNPAVMAQFASALGFRRVRWIQEVFGCQRFPVETTGEPREVGAAVPYLGLWPFDSVSSPSHGGGRIDFRDVSSTICMDCHQTINHIAPLFAYYDTAGTYQPAIAMAMPLEGSPLAELTDFLPPDEATAWRYGAPAADISALGAVMAADPEIARCAVARIWNWALGKGDIVDQLELVPGLTIEPQLQAFREGGYKLNDLIFSVFDADDFVRY